jgi:hypothetical protein
MNEEEGQDVPGPDYIGSVGEHQEIRLEVVGGLSAFRRRSLLCVCNSGLVVWIDVSSRLRERQRRARGDESDGKRVSKEADSERRKYG